MAAGASHPSFLKFVESIKRQQILTNTSIHVGAQKRERQDTVKRTERLAVLEESYLLDGDAAKLLDAVAALYLASD